MKKQFWQVVAEEMQCNPQFRKEAGQIQTSDALIVFAEGHGVSLTREEAEACLPEFEGIFKNDKTLTEDNLSMVSGGGNLSMDLPKILSEKYGLEMGNKG